MDELLNRRLVSAIVARRPRRMVFIKRAVVQNLLVNSAGGNKHEPGNVSTPRGLHELQRPQNISLGKLDDISLRPAKTSTRAVQSRMQYGVAILNQRCRARRVSKVARHPFD